MTEKNADSNNMGIFSCITTPLLVGLLLYGLNKTFGKTTKNWYVFHSKTTILKTTINLCAVIVILFAFSCCFRLFASFWKRAMIEYHSTMREMKKSHFDSMQRQKSADVDLRKKSVLRILEIGAGPGILL